MVWISGLFLFCCQSVLDIQNDSVECQILDGLVCLLDFLDCLPETRFCLLDNRMVCQSPDSAIQVLD